MDIGEPLPMTAVRETKQETGIDVEITGLVGIYTDPNHRIEYTSNGEVRQEFSIVFTARPIGGRPGLNDEATRVEWFELSELEGLRMGPEHADANRSLRPVGRCPHRLITDPRLDLRVHATQLRFGHVDELVYDMVGAVWYRRYPTAARVRFCCDDIERSSSDTPCRRARVDHAGGPAQSS